MNKIKNLLATLYEADEHYATYEEALEEGLKEGLKLIKENK